LSIQPFQRKADPVLEGCKKVPRTVFYWLGFGHKQGRIGAGGLQQKDKIWVQPEGHPSPDEVDNSRGGLWKKAVDLKTRSGYHTDHSREKFNSSFW
jgi:hypothetical protein